MVTKNMTFGEALEAIKKGELVCREGWNGKGMFIFQRPEDCLSTDMVVNKVKSLPDAVKKWVASKYGDSETDKIKFTAYLCMKAADDTIVNGWLASQNGYASYGLDDRSIDETVAYHINTSVLGSQFHGWLPYPGGCD